MSGRKYYRSDRINGKVWFICEYKDCENTELIEEEMICHMREHFGHQSIQTNGGSAVELLDAIRGLNPCPAPPSLTRQCPPSMADRGDQYSEIDYTVNRLKCGHIGCGKTFGFLKAFIAHKKKHQMKVNTKKFVSIGNKATNHSMYNQLKQKYLKVQRISDKNVNRSQKKSHMRDENYRGLQSLKLLRDYYECRIIDGQKNYFCKYETEGEDCRYETNRTQQMAHHINCFHFRNRKFRCKMKGCKKEYNNPHSLRQHELNHQCGFGYGKGRHMDSLCGNKILFSFRKNDIIDGKKIYFCSFMACPFRSESHCAIKRHIHGQHICPFRVRYKDPITGVDVDVGEVIKNMNSHKYNVFNEFDENIIENIVENIVCNDLPEIEIIDETAEESGDHLDPIKEICLRIPLKTDFTRSVYKKCLKELEQLIKIRPYFQRVGKAFSCNECHFYCLKLSSIECHLRAKHFI